MCRGRASFPQYFLTATQIKADAGRGHAMLGVVFRMAELAQGREVVIGAIRWVVVEMSRLQHHDRLADFRRPPPTPNYLFPPLVLGPGLRSRDLLATAIEPLAVLAGP